MKIQMSQRGRVVLCLYALSTLQMGALAVASSIADISDSFPEISTTLVQMLITLPILVQTPMAIVCSWFCKRFSAKTLILTANILFLSGGLLPFFVHSFPVIMLARCLYGAAIGIQIPIVSTLTIEFFEGRRCASVMGCCSAIGMLGGMFYTYAGGKLAGLGWQYSFLAYLIGIPVLICILFLFPRGIKTGAANTADAAIRTDIPMPPELFGLAGLAMIYIIFYFVYTNYISLFVDGTSLGTAAHSGISYSIVNGSGFLGGLLFGTLSGKLKNHVLWFSSFITGIGFFIIGFAYNLPVLYVGSIFLGLGLAWFLPQCNLCIAAIVPPEKLSFAYGLNSAISNMGQFLSVLVIGVLCNVFHIETIRNMFFLAFWGNVSLAIIFMICMFYKRILSP